jgi:hypothetical protein
MDRRITDRRIDGVDFGAPHRDPFAIGGTFEFVGFASLLITLKAFANSSLGLFQPWVQSPYFISLQP